MFSSQYLSRDPHRNTHTYAVQTSHAPRRSRIRADQRSRPRIHRATRQLQPIASLRAEARTNRHRRRNSRCGPFHCDTPSNPGHRDAVDAAAQRRRTACVLGLAARVVGRAGGCIRVAGGVVDEWVDGICDGTSAAGGFGAGGGGGGDYEAICC